jgi:hypothetical protein
MRVWDFAAKKALILRRLPQAVISKDGREEMTRTNFGSYATALP